MPQIIVTAGAADGLEQAAVVLRERVNASDFESERFTVNLLERLGWAVGDATAAEQPEPVGERDIPELARHHWREAPPERDPEPAGVA